MIPVSKLLVGDRLRYDNPLCMGYGEEGVVVDISPDDLGGVVCPVVSIKWDCHGKVIGHLCRDNILHEWMPIGHESLNDWMEG